MENKHSKLIIALFLLVIIGSIVFKIVEPIQIKAVEEKKQLPNLYYKQNTAFNLCVDLSKLDYFHGADELELKNIVMELFAFNSLHLDNQLTAEEVTDYLSDEYNSDGSLRILSQPENIKMYVDWYIGGGEEIAKRFRGYYIDFLKNNSGKKYSDMNYEEIVDALEEYQNDPSYVPPGQKKK